MAQKSLLDLIAAHMKCSYLSDLRVLSREQRTRLYRELDNFSSDFRDLRSWNDALFYLTGAPPEQTVPEAKAQLIRLLTKP